MSVVKRGWFVVAPGKGGRMDYLSLCFVCGAVVLDASEDGQSTWQRHMNWHSPEERKAVMDEIQCDQLAAIDALREKQK